VTLNAVVRRIEQTINHLTVISDRIRIRARHAIVAVPPQLTPQIDWSLADGKRAAVVTDYDSRVVARRRVTARAWELGELLHWSVRIAKAAGLRR